MKTTENRPEHIHTARRQRTDDCCYFMDKTDHSDKMDSLVNDKQTYEVLKRDPTPALQRKLNNKLLTLKKDLENVEKRALSIICPGLAYRKALELSNIMSINDYIASLCKKTFLSIANDPAHRLRNKLQSSGSSCYNLRCKRRFAIPKCKTERFKNSFLVRSCIDNEF